MPVSPFEFLDKKFPSETNKLEVFRAAYSVLEEVPGYLAEFGTYNGGGARQLASLDPGRTVIAFDTYEGMPAEDYHPHEDATDPPGKWKPWGAPSQLFEGIPNIVPMVGRFADTLNIHSVRDFTYVMVHIDCDYYESYTQVLTYLKDRMQPGGVAFLDDYQACAGARRAVDQFLAKSAGRVLGFLNETREKTRLVWG